MPTRSNRGLFLELIWRSSTSPPRPSQGAIGVVPAYAGSSNANHASWRDCLHQPAQFSLFDIGVAINDDPLDLSSSTNGLGQTCHTDQTFNPTYRGYDLGGGALAAFDSVSSKVLEVSFQISSTGQDLSSDP